MITLQLRQPGDVLVQQSGSTEMLTDKNKMYRQDKVSLRQGPLAQWATRLLPYLSEDLLVSHFAPYTNICMYNCLLTYLINKHI